MRQVKPDSHQHSNINHYTVNRIMDKKYSSSRFYKTLNQQKKLVPLVSINTKSDVRNKLRRYEITEN